MEAILDFDRAEPSSSVTGVAVVAGMPCVHFAARRSEHSMWLVDFDEPVIPSPDGNASVVWRELPGAVLHGSAVFARGATCECFLLCGGDAAREPEALRAVGMPKERVALVARMLQRPLLVTVARDGELEPAMLRRLHRLLLSTVAEALQNHAAVTPPFRLPS